MRAPVSLLRQRRDEREAGAAMITVLLMAALLTAFAVAAIGVTSSNLTSSTSDRQSASALSVSEGGIAQAVAYVRTEGVLKIKCSPNCGAANPWGESAEDGDGDPSKVVSLAPNERYNVWFETLQPMDQPKRRPGVYRIHSVGISEPGPGSRTIEVDIEVKPFEYPIGLFSNNLTAGGSSTIQYLSVFSTGCVNDRDKLDFGGNIDMVYGIPAAVHSSSNITESNNCPGTSNNIHTGSTRCNTTYPYDQDNNGANPVPAPCFNMFAGPPTYPTTSLISSATQMGQMYEYNTSGLSDAQLDLLKGIAIEQNNYFTNTTAIPAPISNGTSPLKNPVLFYDLQGAAVGGMVDLNDISQTLYGRPSSVFVDADDASCAPKGGVVVIVKKGNVRLNANTILQAAIFALGPAPNGNVTKSNGGSQLIGTIYAANQFDLTGTADIKIDDCYLENMPGPLLNINVKNFREDDR